MNKRHLIIFVLILLIIVSTGCTGIRRRPDENQLPDEIYKGTEGIKMSFVKNMPQAKLYDASTLSILLELENKGTSDLSGTKCKLYLSGVDKNIVRGLEDEKLCSSSLEARSILNPEGGYNTQEFSSDNIQLPDYLDSLPQTILITSCYEYTTIASPIICIDPHLYEIGPVERACIVKNVPMSGGQGAPIAVTDVNVEMASKTQVAFNIKIANVGEGTALYRGANVFSDCPNSIDPKDYNIIAYDVEMTNGQKLSCSPEMSGDQRTRLVNGKGSIYCTFRISGDSAYPTPLRIILDYNYMESISKNIEIIKTPR